MIVSCDHVGLCLSHGIEGNADDNEKGCTAEVHALDACDVSDEIRKDRHKGKEYSPGQGDSGQYLIYIHHGRLTWTNARDEAAILLHVISEIFDIDRDRGIEIREDKNEEAVADGIGPGAPSKEIADSLYPADMDELCKGDGQHENGRSEDDRNDTSLIHFERQVGGMSAIHSASNDTLCILDRNSALPFIDFDDHEDHDKSNDEEQKQLEWRNGADLQVIDHGGDSLREAGYDTAEDDEGNTITDSVFRNFFADPHEKAGASREDDDDEYKIQPAVIDKGIVDAQGIGHAECLYSCEENREISGDFLDFLEAFLSVFSPFFECRNDGGEELHNDGRVDVRGDTHGKNREFAECTTGEEIQEAEKVSGCKQTFNDRSVNSRHRDMDSQSEDDEHHEGEEDAIFEFFVGKKVCDHRPHIRSPLLFHLLLRFSAERLL